MNRRHDTTELVAPPHLRGRMTRWTPQAIRDERIAWAAEAGRNGASSVKVGKALGIAQRNAHVIMVAGGWDAWAHLRGRA